jgi:hypothetical protein
MPEISPDAYGSYQEICLDWNNAWYVEIGRSPVERIIEHGQAPAIG